ncbi:MAG TPA: alpha/beta fold hydrolase, partial [Candidatus Cybelea sp.]|nr:alpha/beta fold hydrolase [Candidatus Cybelea sp.]
MHLYFVHGSGSTGDVFAAQVEAFTGSYATTLPGHRGGEASGPSSIAEFADAVARELDERALRDVVLCGSSMGGAIALEVALRRNPMVRGVVLLGSGAKLRVAPAFLESMERDFEQAARTLAGMYFAQPTPERIDAAVAAMLAVGQAQTLRDFRACDAFDATARVAELSVPLLAVTGERDAMTPPKFAEWLADRVPGATARI